MGKISRLGGKSSKGPRIGDSGLGDTDERGVDRLKDDDPAEVVVREVVPRKNSSSSNSVSRLKIDREANEGSGEMGRRRRRGGEAVRSGAYISVVMEGVDR